jgi:predicted ArsR family transcriptional regulator
MGRQSKEYNTFNKAMDTILRADPKAVKEAMDAEKRERQLEAERTGKRGRGRPPKHASSGRAPSEKD